MRKILIFLCCFFMMACSNADPVLHDAQGKSIALSQFKNKWIIINYWASWCDSCIKEIPELNRFYHKHRDEDILLYGVNFDKLPLPALQLTIQQMHIQFPILADDPNRLLQLGTFEALPVTFIVNPKGRVVKKIFGPNTAKSLSAAINTLKKMSR